MSPESVDWRNRWGTSWLATVQNQNPCGSCWAFASAALVETMVRIEHHVWSKRSEGDARDGFMASLTPPATDPCGHGAGVQDALGWISGAGAGVADPNCYPYYNSNHPYDPTPDRSGRTVRIPGVTALGSVADQKTWLDTVGPLTASLDVYQTFGSLGDGVWRKTTMDFDVVDNWPKGHVVLVVGYEDANRCWIFRNSWGTGYGVGGYGRIGYGEANIDGYTKYGLQLTSPDPWTRRRMHAGCVIESSNGQAHRNFEMLRAAAPRVRHLWRKGGEDGDYSWYDGGELVDEGNVGAGAGCIGFPSLTQTTFGRNFECVYWELSGHLAHWFFDQQVGRWINGGVFGSRDSVGGYPGFIQSSFGSPGNFEVVVRAADGRLAHWWRRNSPPWTWTEASRFGQDVLQSGPSLVQSRYGKHGNFEVVCVRTDGKMQHYWRDNDGGAWNAGEIFGSDIGDTPVCMIEGQYGALNEKTTGNFELCVAASGRVQHWWRGNSQTPGNAVRRPRRLGVSPYSDSQWHCSGEFGQDIRHIGGLLQSSFGNLEVIAQRNDGAYQHYWRGPDGWHDGGEIKAI